MFFRTISFKDPDYGTNASDLFVGLCNYKAQLGLDLYKVAECNRTTRDKDLESFHHGLLLGLALSGITINCVVIVYWIMTFRRFRNSVNIFNLSLVVVDLMDCFVVPIMIQNDFGKLFMTLNTCKFLLFVHNTATVARPLFLMFLWVSRYQSVVVRSTTKNKTHVTSAQALCTFLAVVASVFSAVPGLMFCGVGTLNWGDEHSNNTLPNTTTTVTTPTTTSAAFNNSVTGGAVVGTCGIKFESFKRSYVSVRMTFMQILMWTFAPLCVVSVTNLLMIQMLHKNRFNKKSKPVLILLAQMVSFLLAESPFTITVLSNLATPVGDNCSDNLAKENLAVATHAFTGAHLSTDPLLYVILGVSIKKIYEQFRSGNLWKTEREARRIQATSQSRLDRLSCGGTSPKSRRPTAGSTGRSHQLCYVNTAVTDPFGTASPGAARRNHNNKNTPRPAIPTSAEEAERVFGTTGRDPVGHGPAEGQTEEDDDCVFERAPAGEEEGLSSSCEYGKQQNRGHGTSGGIGSRFVGRAATVVWSSRSRSFFRRPRPRSTSTTTTVSVTTPTTTTTTDSSSLSSSCRSDLPSPPHVASHPYKLLNASGLDLFIETECPPVPCQTETWEEEESEGGDESSGDAKDARCSRGRQEIITHAPDRYGNYSAQEHRRKQKKQKRCQRRATTSYNKKSEADQQHEEGGFVGYPRADELLPGERRALVTGTVILTTTTGAITTIGTPTTKGLLLPPNLTDGDDDDLGEPGRPLITRPGTTTTTPEEQEITATFQTPDEVETDQTDV
ncbi:G protein-coupled receptor-2 [Proboscivirus elephantidbeta4]|uniref:G protein-coupled receptor-2 n=1 Tax=Elephant endotheliotropic herpesvirus 4 TaxID=548914 RepID=A0A0S1TKM7_9BETA|nr:G protein-coupled receptor-2 [Elephant endotheliotropic herpesvirus 4]ALM25971.1 G protein-coupled receptor-2 [Elephant endotheliotropic herpesvirus 4]